MEYSVENLAQIYYNFRFCCLWLLFFLCSLLVEMFIRIFAIFMIYAWNKSDAIFGMFSCNIYLKFLFHKNWAHCILPLNGHEHKICTKKMVSNLKFNMLKSVNTMWLRDGEKARETEQSALLIFRLFFDKILSFNDAKWLNAEWNERL